MLPKKCSKLQSTIHSFFIASSQDSCEQTLEQNESVPEGIITISETEEPSTTRIITVEERSYQKSWKKEFSWIEYYRCKNRAFCPIRK